MTRTTPSLADMRRQCRKTLPGIAWAAESWTSLGWLGTRRLTRALRREMPPGHRLAGLDPQAIAAELSQDSVLYALSDGRVALVHLTWARPTDNPNWPSTSLYPSLDDFLGGLAVEYAGEAAFARTFEIGGDLGDVYCAECQSNWSDGKTGEGCVTCGDWPLARPCPVCSGACGEVWDRAIQDSQDSGEAHWIGTCRRQT
ncbi:hypothetical protein [Aestuariivita boseongensis]|uniref:hypothetical protein n=1 Tax=Aestuariivita boseongensis TaxID=1470562 RepID=UPI0012FC8343|nr:hypothetical protein [Aestuariivita boseongensis]